MFNTAQLIHLWHTIKENGRKINQKGQPSGLSWVISWETKRSPRQKSEVPSVQSSLLQSCTVNFVWENANGYQNETTSYGRAQQFVFLQNCVVFQFHIQICCLWGRLQRQNYRKFLCVTFALANEPSKIWSRFKISCWSRYFPFYASRLISKTCQTQRVNKDHN